MRSALFSAPRLAAGPAAGALITAIAAAALLATVGPAVAQTATSDTSPVNLSNAIDMANGKAAAAATVIEGNARFEVLTPEVIRMEYSPTGGFLDDPTFDILDRELRRPGLHQQRLRRLADHHHQPDDVLLPGGLRPVHRGQHQDAAARRATPGSLRKRHPDLGLGVRLRSGLPVRGVHPERRGLDRRADHTGYESLAGFVAGLRPRPARAPPGRCSAHRPAPRRVDHPLLNAPAATATPKRAPRAWSSTASATQVTLPTTPSWNDWATVTVPVTLTAGHQHGRAELRRAATAAT